MQTPAPSNRLLRPLRLFRLGAAALLAAVTALAALPSVASAAGTGDGPYQVGRGLRHRDQEEGGRLRDTRPHPARRRRRREEAPGDRGEVGFAAVIYVNQNGYAWSVDVGDFPLGLAVVDAETVWVSNRQDSTLSVVRDLG